MATFQGIKRVHRGREVMVYEGPQVEGEHDDCVISLCLANWGRVRGGSGPEEEIEDLREFVLDPDDMESDAGFRFGGGGYRFGAPGWRQ